MKNGGEKRTFLLLALGALVLSALAAWVFLPDAGPASLADRSVLPMYTAIFLFAGSLIFVIAWAVREKRRRNKKK